MPDAETNNEPAPHRAQVAHYLSDMVAQLAAMALGAGLKDVAGALTSARDLCEDALERG